MCLPMVSGLCGWTHFGQYVLGAYSSGSLHVLHGHFQLLSITARIFLLLWYIGSRRYCSSGFVAPEIVPYCLHLHLEKVNIPFWNLFALFSTLSKFTSASKPEGPKEEVDEKKDEGKRRQRQKKHTTPGIRWSSATQLLVWRSLACLWESGRDPEFSSTYGRMRKEECRNSRMRVAPS